MYIARIIEKIQNRPGTWRSTRVGVFCNHEEAETQIGEYTRNYPNLFNTFHPFEIKDEWYALYSRDYTATRIMRLPSCEDIGGEAPDEWGFCPVDYHIPIDKDEPHDTQSIFGLVAGCIWGDDSSWKVQFLDLSNICQGVIKREERFGYIELPNDKSLKEAIRYGDLNPDYFEITIKKTFNWRTGEAD